MTARRAGPRDHLILYDADCGFCRWSVDRLLALDRRGRLRPVAIQSAEGQGALAGMAPEARLASWHLAPPGREPISAGAAAAPIARLLPGGRPVARLLEAAPGATQRAYVWVADHRGDLGRVLRVRHHRLRRG